MNKMAEEKPSKKLSTKKDMQDKVSEIKKKYFDLKVGLS